MSTPLYLFPKVGNDDPKPSETQKVPHSMGAPQAYGCESGDAVGSVVGKVGRVVWRNAYMSMTALFNHSAISASSLAVKTAAVAPASTREGHPFRREGPRVHTRGPTP